jgi:hypothetical protein
MKSLYIKNKIINNHELSNNGYLAYLGVTMLLRQNEISYFSNTDYLAYLLSKKYPAEQNLKNNIHNGIIDLEKSNLISFENTNESRQEWIINADKLIKDAIIDKENKTLSENLFTIIDKDGIRKILSSTNQYYTKSISLVRFYSYLLSTIHNKDDDYKGVGFTSISEIANNTMYNQKTVSQYIKQLVDLEVIYVFKSKDFIKFDDGDIIEISHTYGRYKDKELVEQKGKQHEIEYGERLKSSHKKINKSNADNIRKYSQMYKHIYDCLLDGKEIKYSDSEIKNTYLTMCKLNKKYEKERKDRVKDLSIFSNYDFYDEDW